MTDSTALFTALTAAFMVGSTHLRVNLWLFSIQTALLAMVTALYAGQRHDISLLITAIMLFSLKVLFVPKFLSYLVRHVQVARDSGALIPAPVAMHISLVFMFVSYSLAVQLPAPLGSTTAWATATAAISLVCTGLILMLTRRIALSQIIGFLVMENGIYLFGLTQIRSMPMLIEMGIMLDVLAGVMIAGFMVFKIKKSFEHIDVSLLTELRE